QQSDRVRRIGVLFEGSDENDPEGKRRYSAFTQALADLGWAVGRNVQMDLRWAGGDTNGMPWVGTPAWATPNTEFVLPPPRAARCSTKAVMPKAGIFRLAPLFLFGVDSCRSYTLPGNGVCRLAVAN